MIRIVLMIPGTESRQVFEFEDARDEIVVGRDPSCDVVVPESFMSVSRRHCSIERRMGRYCLVTDTRNPAYVNGAPADTGLFLDSGQEVELVEGVRFLFEHDVLAVGVPTLRRGKKVPTPREQATAAQSTAQQVGRNLAGHQRSAYLTMAVIAVVAVGGLTYVARSASAEALQVRETVPTKEEVAKLRALVEATAAESDERIRRVPDAARSSVYMVVHERGGSVGSVGTCWVLDKDNGVLATNAHVAQLFEERKLPLFVRVPVADRFEDLAVRSVRVHPGYRAFGEEQGRSTFRNLLGRERDCAALCPACDVAMLYVAKEDQSHLGASLPIADSSELEQLTLGMDVCYVGYPTEGAYDNATAPGITAHIGHLSAVTDFFHRAVPSSEAELLQTSVPASGGASGGPILGPNGHVLGLLSAGNVVFVSTREGARSRIASGPGITFAQRVDLLRELEASATPAKQEERSKRWQQRFEDIRQDPSSDELLNGALKQAFYNLNGINYRGGSDGKAQQMFDKSVRFAEALNLSLGPLPAAGRILVTVLTEKRAPTSLVVGRQRVDGPLEMYPRDNPGPVLVPMAELDVAEGEHLLIRAGSASPGEAKIVVFLIPKRKG